MEMASAIDVVGRDHELRKKNLQYIRFSSLKKKIKPKIDDCFFLFTRNIGLNREIPGHRDTLKTYYEKGSVLWKNCAWGRENFFNLSPRNVCVLSL